MARKGPGFRQSKRDAMLESLRGQSYYASLMPLDDPRRAEQQERLAAERAAIAPKRVRAKQRDLEGPVKRAIQDLLSVHPRVIWAARFNSGSAINAAGAPIVFHKFVRMPEPMRMPDFFGIIRNGQMLIDCGIPISMLAIEAKAPGWTKPTNDREREQAAFLAMIRSAGGIGIFATSSEDVAKALA